MIYSLPICTFINLYINKLFLGITYVRQDMCMNVCIFRGDWGNIIEYKTILMMSWISPRFDVEMSKKTKFRGGHLRFLAAILDFWWPSWIDNGYLLSLYSISINYCINFGTFIKKWTIDPPIVIFYHFSQCRPEVVICKSFQ